MTEAADRSEGLGQRSLLTDRTTIAALLVMVSAAIFVFIAFTNRHNHNTHDHPSATVATDVSASDPEHDHSTHDHGDLGSTFVNTERISPPAACRTIVGCDDAGPKPQNPGDRGGWAQFLTLGAVAVGLAFIATKIIRATRGARTTRDTQS